VTGINGFIGKHIAEFWGNQTDYFVTGVDLADSFSPLNSMPVHLNYSKLDMTHVEEVNRFFEDRQFDIIIHLAGILSKKEDKITHQIAQTVNFTSTSILLEIAREQNAHFIFTSTSMVYGDRPEPFKESMKKNPENIYALTKSLSEDLVLYFHKKFQVPYTIFRPSILYGIGQVGDSFIPSLIHTLRKNEEFRMTKGEQIKDFIYIDDFLSALKLVLDQNVLGIYNIGNGTGVPIKKVAECIGNKLVVNNKIKIGAIPYRNNEIWSYVPNCRQLKNVTGWKPTIPLEQGIEKILNDLKNKGK
jgi:nucleoside-diphosphate-sugar epimerase